MPDVAEMLETARRHHKDGDAPKAEQLYRQVLWTDPHNADVAYSLAAVCKEQGRLPEAMTHLHKALAIRPNFAEAYNAQALIFAAKGELKEAQRAFNKAINIRPDYAEAHHNVGVTFARNKQLDEAIKAFRQAIHWKSDYPDAHVNLARAFEQQGNIDEAINAFDAAVRLGSNDASNHNSLGLLLAKRARTTEAVEHFRHTVKLAPDNAGYRNNLGVALTELGRPAESLEHFEAAVRLQPDHAEAHKSLAMTWLHMGDFKRGWPEYEWRLKCKDANPRVYPQPLWDGTALEGRRILVYTEQGVGDIFQFLRYVPLLAQRGGLVTLECPRSLVPILRTCPGAAHVIAHGSPMPEFECHVPLLSLPRWFGTTMQTVPSAIPYLSAAPDLVERWRKELSANSAFRVGIVWQGNPKNGSDYRRSMALKHFTPLAAIPGVSLFSLQKGAGTEQLAEVLGTFPVTDLGGRLDFGGFMMTAAAICNMDLIVACDTSTAHLAGALGKPVYMAISYASDWRWLIDREDTPWYSTMRLFRQPKLGDWASVIGKMAADLLSLVAEKKRSGKLPEATGSSA